MPGVDVLAGGELVHGAAVRAAGFAGAGDIEEHARVAVPQLHVGLGVGAEDATLRVQVGGLEFDRWLAHGRFLLQTLASQWAYLLFLPLTTSKKALCSFSVMGPREPAPIWTRSSSRIGVTSAAVPVKKASSAM